jgi:hypothetical protein
MFRSVAGTIGIAILGAVLVAGCASEPPAAEKKDSGFLRDYTRLQDATAVGGAHIRAWASPKFTPANYNAIILEPLVFYPEPQPSAQVSADTLQQILKYTNNALRQSLTKRFQVVDKAGPGVVRIRTAFSSVGAEKEGLKAYQYIPLAFVATMASRAATGEPQQAFVFVEAEVTDSATGELLALRTRVGTGSGLSKVGGKEVVTLDDLKPLIDELATGAYPELSKFVKPK